MSSAAVVIGALKVNIVLLPSYLLDMLYRNLDQSDPGKILQGILRAIPSPQDRMILQGKGYPLLCGLLRMDMSRFLQQRRLCLGSPCQLRSDTSDQHYKDL